MNEEAREIVERLQLAPLPREGGFFRQTWLSPERLPGGRAAGSAILFLLTPGDFSALHRLETDELWHFCAGDPVSHLQLDPGKAGAVVTRLGPEPSTDAVQLLVPGRVWQGARLEETASAGAPRGWALLACTMAPAWDEKEFTLGDPEALARAFPAQAALISALAR
ncbi:MAG TPA: cupin domain-containing protein [Opitutaceae bacterium]|nr:cupin domain-containing protein [Opitutaceae bacterium]